MNINKEIWQPETFVVDENNSYHDADFSASSGKITKTFNELCLNSKEDFFRTLDDTNIVGEYISDKRNNPVLSPVNRLYFEQKDGKIFLSVSPRIKLEEFPFRLCTQNGLRDIELNQPYGRFLMDNHEYNYNDLDKADDLIRFLLDFPIKNFLNTVYVSVKHVYYEQQDNIQYGFFEIPDEFYLKGGICTLQNYLNLIKEKPENERDNYIIDNWWIMTDYLNSKKEIVPYFYNIFLSVHWSNAQFSQQLINTAALSPVYYKKENNQLLKLYYYYYQDFYFMEYKNKDFNIFYNTVKNQNSTKIIKEQPLWGVYSLQSKVRMQRQCYNDNTSASFLSSFYFGDQNSECISDLEEGKSKKIGKIFIGRYKSSQQLLETYEDGDKLVSNSNLFVMLKIWQPEEIEMLMNDMICCWSAQELNEEQKLLFFSGELDDQQIKNVIKIPVVKNNYYITGEHNYGKNAYDCLPNNMLDFQDKNDIDKILPEPNFSNERNLDVIAKDNYDDIFQLQKNVSLWGIKEKDNGKFLISKKFPYSYYRNNQINPFVGMVRTKIIKPTVTLNGDNVEISNLNFVFEDVVKKSVGEDSYNLANVHINDFSLDNTFAQAEISINQAETEQNSIENRELNYGFYRGEVTSWSENDYETITFRINVSYYFEGNLEEGDKAIFFLEDETGAATEDYTLTYHSEAQSYPDIRINLKAYDQNKNKKIYRIKYWTKKNGEQLCRCEVENKYKDITIDDNNLLIKMKCVEVTE